MRARTVLGVALAAAALAGCDAKETGPEEGAPETVPAVAAPVPTVTEDPGATAPLASFIGRDGDDDGWLTSAEQGLAAQKIFAAIDADKDGGITVAEMDAAREALGLLVEPASEKLIADADSDGDSKLTLAEWVASSNAEFAQSDKDKDGKLSLDEWNSRIAANQAAAPAQ